MRTVARLAIAPVKSLALWHPTEVRITPNGVLEDRRFHLVDADGRRVSGPKHGPLVRIRAAYDASTERLSLTLPDGVVVEGPADRITGDAITSDFYGRPVVGHEVQGPFGEAISSLARFSVRLVRSDRAGDAVDVWPLSIMSTASAEELARRTGSDRPTETRRFRMSIELSGCEPFEEDTWVGRTVRIGQAVVRIPGPIPRCAVTTFDPDTGVRDFGTLHAIKQIRGQGADGDLYFGVYGDVVEPGIVRTGDGVVVETADGSAG
jgi:hypothetical protein